MMSIHVCCIVSYSIMKEIRGLNPSCQTEATIQPSRFASIFVAGWETYLRHQEFKMAGIPMVDFESKRKKRHTHRPA